MKSAIAVRCLKIALLLAGIGCVSYGLWNEFGEPKSVRLPHWGGDVRIVAIPPSVDCVHEGDQSTATTVIVLRNEGSRVGKLLDVTASCGCTVPQALPADTLQPGEEVRLTIQAQLPGYGLKHSNVAIRTDAPESPLRIPLRLHGRKLATPYLSSNLQQIRIESTSANSRPRPPFKSRAWKRPASRG